MYSLTETLLYAGDDPAHVKTKLRHWAQAVACSVMQSQWSVGSMFNLYRGRLILEVHRERDGRKTMDTLQVSFYFLVCGS